MLPIFHPFLVVDAGVNRLGWVSSASLRPLRPLELGGRPLLFCLHPGPCWKHQRSRKNKRLGTTYLLISLHDVVSYARSLYFCNLGYLTFCDCRDGRGDVWYVNVLFDASLFDVLSSVAYYL